MVCEAHNFNNFLKLILVMIHLILNFSHFSQVGKYYFFRIGFSFLEIFKQNCTLCYSKKANPWLLRISTSWKENIKEVHHCFVSVLDEKNEAEVKINRFFLNFQFLTLWSDIMFLSITAKVLLIMLLLPRWNFTLVYIGFLC